MQAIEMMCSIVVQKARKDELEVQKVLAFNENAKLNLRGQVGEGCCRIHSLIQSTQRARVEAAVDP